MIVVPALVEEDTPRGRKLSLNCLFGGRRNNEFDFVSSFRELIAELSIGSRRRRVNVFHRRSGVDGHVGDDFLFSTMV